MSDALAGIKSLLPKGAADPLTLTVGGNKLTGWQRVMVRRSLEAIPATYELEVTERYPGAATIDVQPGQPCTVKIGADLVITGYVDRYAAQIAPNGHAVRIQGRSKSADLVDCAAFDGTHDKPNLQISQGNALSIIKRLAGQYGVEVASIAGDGRDIRQFNIIPGETTWEVIDRITRYSQLIAYDMPDGSLRLAQAGKEKMASGFALGQNIQAASVVYSMDERFSEYEALITSVQVYFTDGGTPPPRGSIVNDKGVPRYRKHYIISEQTDLGTPLAEARAVWEMNRRQGRSTAVHLTCDAWRDSAGALWAPNHGVSISAKELKVPALDWIIADVTYIRDENGQRADLTLMPSNAFLPEPVGTPGVIFTTDTTKKTNPTAPDNPKPPTDGKEKIVVGPGTA
jgi:prophage tail gpP-like protein